jgi:hypothetical protein
VPAEQSQHKHTCAWLALGRVVHQCRLLANSTQQSRMGTEAVGRQRCHKQRRLGCRRYTILRAKL